VQEQVSVSANAVQVEAESTQLGDVVDSKKMLSVPLNGRSYIELLGLQAGVVPVTSGTMQQDRPVSGILSSGNLSVNGQRETANAFLVNGGDVSEGRNLGAGLIPNLDSIEEFRLITNSFDAEYGKFSGAVMNAITKSGTNGFHGDVFEFLRNEKLDANNYFANKLGLGKTELRRNQFGYTAGGPVWKDHLFFFSDYQGTRQVQDSSPLGYHLAFCTNNAQCVFPNGALPQSAWAAPATAILSYIPAPTVSGNSNNYSNNSGRNVVNDDKYGERIDFNNQKTGN